MTTKKILSIVFFTFFTIQASLSQISMILQEGMKAPNFSLQNYQGKIFKLSSYKGKSPVVIYFYPKAGTPGCTKEACGIRDDLRKFKNKNIVVLGISTDTKIELKKFIRENKINFPLLSDHDKIVTEKYGVLRDDGKAKRFTFIIDRKGRIAKIIEVTDISRHSHDVYEIASKL